MDPVPEQIAAILVCGIIGSVGGLVVETLSLGGTGGYIVGVLSMLAILWAVKTLHSRYEHRKQVDSEVSL